MPSPSTGGWLLALAYGGAAALPLLRAASLPPDAARRRWLTLAALFAALSLATLARADLRFVGAMRAWARSGGWYGERRSLQCAVLLALIPAAAVAWRREQQLWLGAGPNRALVPALGAGLLCAAVVVLRLVSLHYTDHLLDFRLGGVSVGRWLEAGGIAWFVVTVALPSPGCAGSPS